MTKICVWCQSQIKPTEKSNFLMGSHSHESCDKDQHGAIDKRIKYV